MNIGYIIERGLKGERIMFDDGRAFGPITEIEACDQSVKLTDTSGSNYWICMYEDFEFC